ncbi:hypothetical protein BG015_011919 [Linnemannia schmuckeri]|uniref:Spondin domain-containing protein n=1 Tax=Linnemannia schmuckeri TaxID=64567 RepID=A0A9P5VEC3_9FUNG|nr:hypothetical protein BG015_011919 [Linnemannia schmuckeri]
MSIPSTTWSPTTTTATLITPTTTWTSPTTTTTWPTTTTTTTTTAIPPPTTPPPPRTTTTQNPITSPPPIRTSNPATSTTPFTSLIGTSSTSVIPTSTDRNVVPTSIKGPGDGTGGGISKVAVIGIVVAGVAVIGFVSIVLVMKNQRHKRRQKELDPNKLFGHFHNPPSPSPLTHITSGHHHNNHDQYPEDNQYDHGGTHQHEMEQLYHNSDYHHQNHGHHDGGHHGGDYNGYDHGGGHDSGGTNQAQSHYDPSSGQGQAQSNTYNNPSSGGHQAIGNDGATGNQYAPNGGNGCGGDFQGVGQGVSDTGNYDYGVGQGQHVGGVDQGHHNLYDGYGSGHDTGAGYGHGGNDFGGYGQGQVDPSSGYGGNGMSGGSSNIGATGTGAGSIGGGGGGGGMGSPPITSIPSGLQGGYAPFAIGAIPPPVPFIPNRNSSNSNRISVNPANTTAQQESYLLDMTSIPAAQGTSSTSYRPLDRFSSNASKGTRYSGNSGNSPVPPPVPPHPGSSTISYSTWDDSSHEFRPERPLSQTSLASSTTAGPYHQSIGSPIMYQDFIPPPNTKSPSPMIASVLPVTTSSTAGVRRSVGAPQDRGPDLAAASGGQASDLNAFERRAPQTQQETVQNPDSLFNAVASTLRQPQGGP